MQSPILIPDNLGYGPNLTAIYRLAINRRNRHNSAGSRANKDLIRLEGHLNRNNLKMDSCAVVMLLRNFQNCLASDTLENAPIWSIQGAIFDNDDVITRSLGQIGIPIRQKRIYGPSIGCLQQATGSSLPTASS